jgi:hypothetical protein
MAIAVTSLRYVGLLKAEHTATDNRLTNRLLRQHHVEVEEITASVYTPEVDS